MNYDPLKEWYADPSNLQQLTSALNLPAIRKAFEVLKFVAQPRRDFAERGSADAITHAAMEHKRCEGFFSFFDDIYQLSEALPEAQPKPVAYSDSYVLEWALRKGLIAAEDIPPTEQSNHQP